MLNHYTRREKFPFWGGAFPFNGVVLECEGKCRQRKPFPWEEKKKVDSITEKKGFLIGRGRISRGICQRADHSKKEGGGITRRRRTNMLELFLQGEKKRQNPDWGRSRDLGHRGTDARILLLLKRIRAAGRMPVLGSAA